MIPFLLDKQELSHLAALEQDEILQDDEKLEKAVDEVLDGVEWVIEEQVSLNHIKILEKEDGELPHLFALQCDEILHDDKLEKPGPVAVDGVSLENNQKLDQEGGFAEVLDGEEGVIG